MRARLILASALAVGALLTGCQSDITGTPVSSPDSPTEPSVPTSRPTRTPTAAPAPPPPAPPPSPAPPAAEALTPENGWVFIETKSGKTRCQVSAEEVDCEAPFANAPVVEGIPATGVRVTAGGQVEWVVGNLGDIPVVTLDYRTYSAVGWTIQAEEDGTRFTNDGTRHGMAVSVEGVETF